MKIGQYVEVPVNATETIIGQVKTRYYNAQRQVLLAVETPRGVVTAYEWYAKPAEDPYAAERAQQKAHDEAQQAAKARKAAEEAAAARLQAAAKRAAAKQEKRERRELERTANQAARQEVATARLQGAAERAAGKQERRERRDLQRTAKHAATQAAKQTKADHEAAEAETTALRERTIAAEAQATVDAMTFDDPHAGWIKTLEQGETTYRSTLTRTVAGGALLGPAGAVFGHAAKKGSGHVYVRVYNAAGAMVDSSRHAAEHAWIYDREVVQFNRLHTVLPDGGTQYIKNSRAHALKKARRAIEKRDK
jgi:hypothetical protein